MDLKGSLTDTKLKIYPSETFIKFIQTVKADDIPDNFLNFIKDKTILEHKKKEKNENKELCNVKMYDKDVEIMRKINDKVEQLYNSLQNAKSEAKVKIAENNTSALPKQKYDENARKTSNLEKKEIKNESEEKESSQKTKEEGDESATADTLDSFSKIQAEREGPYLLTADINWLHSYLEEKRKNDKNLPYIHELFEGTDIETPRNQVLKRNPVLEARCVKLRAQQEAREYRKMTKSVDNVRIRFPDDSIAYQLKQINRQLIAIGQFIISIFAGFLFGFKGVEWMIGHLDFGFRLLLGVMCALIIALAEIYFLAKKLNEELNVPETTQLGGPPKFVDEGLNQKTYNPELKGKIGSGKNNTETDKEHQD